MQPLSDEELLRLCARRENVAIQELVRRYQSSLARFFSRLLSSQEDVEEALLNVFLRAWQYAPRFQYRAKVKTLLYRIAVNIAYDFQRQSKRLQRQALSLQLDQPQANAEEEALHKLEREEQARALQCALARLHPTDRTLLVLYYYEQMDYEQIQGIMELSYTVLKTRLSRARRRLRQLLEEEDREATL
jgi:RNA polymerase sigma-70 factor (ECF subfamily)